MADFAIAKRKRSSSAAGNPSVKVSWHLYSSYRHLVLYYCTCSIDECNCSYVHRLNIHRDHAAPSTLTRSRRTLRAACFSPSGTDAVGPALLPFISPPFCIGREPCSPCPKPSLPDPPFLRKAQEQKRLLTSLAPSLLSLFRGSCGCGFMFFDAVFESADGSAGRF